MGPAPRAVGRLRLSLVSVLIVATVIVGAAVDARYRLPDLQLWHRNAPESEVQAADIDERFTLADYLAREQQCSTRSARVSRRLSPPPATTR